jgi:glutamine amidotransferase
VTTVIDYNAGNLRSVETALHHLGAPFQVTADPAVVARADRVILPGVGDAGAAMEELRARELVAELRELPHRGVPLLGICLGSQIILERSAESDAPCLHLLPGEAVPFSISLKVPHMGWNTIVPQRDHAIFHGFDPDSSFYFVHSYFPQPMEGDAVIATCTYEQTFAAVVGFGSVVATQFHPEKSGEPGLRMLDAFLRWNP